MLTRSMFSSGTAAVAEPWADQSISAQNSLKKGFLGREPDSPQSGDSFIATAVPSDVAAAADKALGIATTQFTPAGTVPDFDSDLSKASFEQLCHDGSQWSWSNWQVKLWRYTLLITKQIYLVWLAVLSVPTNHLMLTFRTMIRDFGEPNGNADYLAAKFRDELMPSRGRLHRQKSPLVKINRWFLETPYLGIPGIVRFIDVRTQWMDDSVKAALEDGIKQVVIIAAGYDTRAYRLAQPGVRFYEIDLPHASQHKQDLVRKLLPANKFSRPEFVAADLSKVRLADALATTTFNPKEPAVFTVEGLVYYLPPCAVKQLLSCISTISAPRSRLIMDFLHMTSLSGEVWHPGFETLWISVFNKGERMYSGIDERPAAVAALMHKFGFLTKTVLTARDLVEHYMPHVQYKTAPPTVSPFFGYLSAEKL